ncbi:hypothetical protein [Nocardia speluncae]|uniref:hypothetical protein n=1 Tax=Nocardia speluncae TaxID=419477 RepID=UPI003FCD2CAE
MSVLPPRGWAEHVRLATSGGFVCSLRAHSSPWRCYATEELHLVAHEPILSLHYAA